MVTFRRKRKVRLHMAREEPSIEGVLLGRRPVGGHYLVLLPTLLENAETSTSLVGHVEVPQANVLFVQVLAD